MIEAIIFLAGVLLGLTIALGLIFAVWCGVKQDKTLLDVLKDVLKK